MKTKGLIVGIVVAFLCMPAYAKNQNYHTCSATPAKGTVALTFDDGPSPVYTQKIMKILDKYHIKGTFFVVGQRAQSYPKYLKALVADGDIIGNHSYSHPQVSKLRGDKLYKEVVAPENIIYKITGEKPLLFRFPYGAENKRVKQYVSSQGLTPVHWGYSPQDYTRPGAGVIASRVISHARSGQVILLHDGPKQRQQTVDALPKIIEGIKKKGLGFSVLCR